MCKLQVDKSVQPFFYTRRAIKEKIKRLKHMYITKKVEGLQDWIKNLVDICKR